MGHSAHSGARDEAVEPVVDAREQTPVRGADLDADLALRDAQPQHELLLGRQKGAETNELVATLVVAPRCDEEER